MDNPSTNPYGETIPAAPGWWAEVEAWTTKERVRPYGTFPIAAWIVYRYSRDSPIEHELRPYVAVSGEDLPEPILLASENEEHGTFRLHRVFFDPTYPKEEASEWDRVAEDCAELHRAS